MKLSPLLCALLLAGICSIYLHQVLQHQSWSQAEVLLRHVLHGISKQIAQEGATAKEWSTLIQPTTETNHLRLSIIDAQGVVIADNHGSPEQMDNHLQRPEIKAAIASPLNVGQSKRISRSIGIDYYYFAEAFYQGDQLQGVVRLAMPIDNIIYRFYAHFFAIALPIYLILFFMAVIWTIHTRKSQQQSSDTPLPYKQTRHETQDNDHVIWQKDRAFNLGAMLNSLSEGIIAVNQDEQIVYINTAAANILQHQADDVLGQSVWDSGRVHVIPECIHNCLKKSETIHQEFQVLRQVKQVHYAIQVSPIFQHGNDENIYAAVAIIDDISDQQRLEGLRRNFFTNISHELKTPLAVIKGVIETMIDDPEMLEQQRSSFLEKAFNQCNRLGMLVGDILTISHLEDQDTLLDKETISLTGILRESVHNLQNRAEQKHIHIQAHIPKDACKIDGDRELMQQVFDNLLSNAINYSPQDSQVTVQLEIKDDVYIISVIDNGPGIPPLAQERIFERFFRVDKARSRQVGGTGLGLAIAKHAAALHGGSISVQSEISKGSTFIVHIPHAYAGAQNG